MRSAVLKTVVVSLLAAASVWADGKCSASARECEQQIRHMLSGRRYLGLQIVELKPGLVVKTVIDDSPAQRAGMKENDRLIGCNGVNLKKATAREFKQVLASASATGTIFMIIQRRGALKKIELRLEPYPKEQVDRIIAQHLIQSHPATAGGQ